MTCPFCNILTNESHRIINSKKHVFVVLSDPRLMQGHLLVIPKRHVVKLSELDKEERDELVTETVRLQEKVLEKIAPGCDISQHYRPFIPDNPLKVSHLHIHIRPRFLDDELYTKVQIFEKDVFAKSRDEEYSTYKNIFEEKE